jgi:hypothetical protein
VLATGVLVVFATVPASASLVRDHRNPSRGGGSFDLEATPVFELPIRLTANERVVFETRNLSEGSDPVLHLLGPQATGSSAAFEVARDDDSLGSFAARLTYTAPVTGTYTLVMRAAWNGRDGTADLFRNGRLIWPDLPFGGAFKRLEGLRKAETLTTVALPRGPFEHVLYIINDTGALVERHRSGDTLGTQRTLPASWGVRNVLLGVSWLGAPGPVRLVRNDAALSGHDPDVDGLGRELETVIATCSLDSDIVDDWSCNRSRDMRDTDGDAISDALELLGYTAKEPYQLLPRWGADPRHKDIFIEMDFMMKETDDSDGMMTPETVRQVAAIYADPETYPTFRRAHARALGNPDFEPGIRLHVDTGLSPGLGDPAADFTLYGDWGGHNAVPPVCSAGECEGESAADAWTDHMHPNRRGLFHYALTYEGGGGSTPPHKIYSSFNHGSASNSAHEFGHSVGLGHNGPHGGEPIDANCKPNYPSIMNYAYHYRGHMAFADGFGRSVVNNTNVKERAAVGNPASESGRRYLEHLRDIFDYDIDLQNGDVDWNRDGVFSPGTVRAYTNNNGESCEFTKYNSVRLPSVSDRSPALARLGTMTMAFFLTPQGALQFDYTLDSLACPEPAVKGCGPGLLSQFIDESWNRNIRAFDAHLISDDGVDKILVVYVDAERRLWETKFSRVGFAWSQPIRIATASIAVDEISLAGGRQVTFLAYKSSGRRVILKQRSADGAWGTDEVARDSNNVLLPRLPPGSSPALLLVNAPGGGVLYGAFPEEHADAVRNGFVRLYSLVLGSSRWEKSPWLTATAEGTQGKPAMAWESVSESSALPGRLRLFWLTRNADGETVVRERQLIAKNVNGALEIRMGRPSDHQNEWFYAYGVDLLYEEGVDSNLRALVARKKRNDEQELVPNTLELRPKADGIVNFDLRNRNDWEVLGVDTCRVLSESAVGQDRIRCPDWKW